MTDHVHAGEARKVVTVLFSDVTGSTVLGEALDPESLRRLMGRYFQEVKAVQVPEEAFAQQRERDKVQRMSSSQRHWVRVSQFRRGMRTGIACSYHQDGTWRNLGRIAVGGRVKLLDLWRERRGKCRNAWVVKWPCCHDDGGRLIGALGGLQNERLRTLLHVHNSRVRLDGKCKVVGIGLEVVGKFTEGWTDFALKGGNLH